MTQIKIAAPYKKIAAGKSVKLSAAAAPAGAANKKVVWKSDNTKAATVNASGVVKTKKAGIGKTVTITAYADDGSGVKASVKLKIMRHAVKKITLSSKTKKKTVKAGKKLVIRANVATTGKSANKTLKWSTSNSRYATVNTKGVVTAKKAGKGKSVKITAATTDGTNKKGTITIKIK